MAELIWAHTISKWKCQPNCQPIRLTSDFLNVGQKTFKKLEFIHQSSGSQSTSVFKRHTFYSQVLKLWNQKFGCNSKILYKMILLKSFLRGIPLSIRYGLHTVLVCVESPPLRCVSTWRFCIPNSKTNSSLQMAANWRHRIFILVFELD